MASVAAVTSCASLCFAQTRCNVSSNGRIAKRTAFPNYLHTRPCLSSSRKLCGAPLLSATSFSRRGKAPLFKVVAEGETAVEEVAQTQKVDAPADSAVAEASAPVESAVAEASAPAESVAAEDDASAESAATPEGEVEAKPAARRPFKNRRKVTVNIEDLQPGQVLPGKVRSIQSYGCFVDIGAYTDGLIHISELADQFVDNVGDLVEVGQELQTRILEIDPAKGRISLSMRTPRAERAEPAEGAEGAPQSDRGERGGRPQRGPGGPDQRPRRAVAGRGGPEKPSHGIRKGQKYEGTVTNIATFGAFLELKEGVEGLLHASEIGEGTARVDVAEHLTMGQKVRVTVLSVSKDRISLTTKERVDTDDINVRLNQGSEVGTDGITNPFEAAFKKSNLALNTLPGAEELAKTKKPEPTAATTDEIKTETEEVKKGGFFGDKKTSEVTDVGPVAEQPKEAESDSTEGGKSEAVQEKSYDVVEDGKEAAQAVSEGVEPIVDEVTEAVTETAEPVNEKVEEVAENVSEAIKPVREDAKDAAQAVGEGVEPIVDEVTDAVTEAAEPLTERVEKVAENVSEAINPAPEDGKDAAKAASEGAEKNADEVTDAVKETAEPVSEKAEEGAENVSEAAKSVTEDGKDAAQAAREGVEKNADEVTDAVKETAEPVTEQAEGVAENASKAVESAAEDGKDAARAASDAVTETAESASEKVEEVVEDAREAVKPVTEAVSEAASNPVEAAQSAVEKVSEPVSDAVEKVTDSAKETVEPAVEKVSETTSQAVEKVKEGLDEAPEKQSGGSDDVAEPAVQKGQEVAENVKEAAEPVNEKAEEVADSAKDAVQSAKEEANEEVPAGGEAPSLAEQIKEAADEGVAAVTGVADQAAKALEEATKGGEEAPAPSEEKPKEEEQPKEAETPKAEEKPTDAEKPKEAGGISAAQVKVLRTETGAGMMDCKKALTDAGGDIDKARDILRKKGLASADKKASRVAAEGAIGSYVHDSRIGVLLELNCETDFVSRGETFRELLEDLAMQVAACPQVEFVSVDEVPPEFVAKEREIEAGKEDLASKPPAIREKMVDGRINKRLGELALLEQPYIKDDKLKVKDLVKATVAKIGENIQVRRFERFNLGEGLEKKTSNLAAEVAQQTQKKEAAPGPASPPPEEKKTEEAAEAKPTVAVSPAAVKKLRGETGAGMMDCKKALVECDNDVEKAVEFLRKKGLASADKKASRVAAEGAIGSYIHDSRIGVLVEVNCETDFVARGEKFRELLEDVAMQVAACPQVTVVSPDDVPAEMVAKEREIELGKEDLASKPEAIREKMVDGRMAKRVNELALLEQPYIRDDKQKLKDVIKATVAAVGENIQVRRFVRYNLGEGVEKKSVDFAAEVAAQTGKA